MPELTAAPQSLFLEGKLLRPGELMDRGDRPDSRPPPCQNPQQGKPLEMTAQQNFPAKQNSTWKTNNPSHLKAIINLQSILSGVGLPPGHTYISSPSLCPCGLLLQRTSQQHRELHFQGSKTEVQAQNSITCNININHSIYTMTAGQHKSIVLFKACLIRWLLPCPVSCKRLWPLHEENKSTSQQQE